MTTSGTPRSFLHVNFILTDAVGSGRWRRRSPRIINKNFPRFILFQTIPRKPTTHGELAPPPAFPFPLSLYDHHSSPPLPPFSSLLFFFHPFIQPTSLSSSSFLYSSIAYPTRLRLGLCLFFPLCSDSIFRAFLPLIILSFQVFLPLSLSLSLSLVSVIFMPTSRVPYCHPHHLT